MMTTVKIKQITTILCCLFSVGICIKCFQCNSAMHPQCADLTVNDTNSQFYRTCTGNYDEHVPFCRKLVTEVVTMDDRSRSVLRSCGWIQEKQVANLEKCRKSDTDFIKRKSCVCITDACNASGKVSASIITLSIVITVFMFFFHL